MRDASGNLYGTTSSGGATGNGVVFKLDTTGTETVLHDFTGGTTDGGGPRAGLVRDTSGNLYGTTSGGGIFNCVIRGFTPRTVGCGIVFKLDTTGTETVLYSFAGGSDGPDGAFPETRLVRDASGNLYGTTVAGAPGPCDIIAMLPPQPSTFVHCGTVFKLDTAGTEVVLHSFTGGGTGFPSSQDGASPRAGLVLDGSGNLYGTTLDGGAGGCVESGTRPDAGPVFIGCGTVFKVDATGKETVLYNFTGFVSPRAGLVLDAESNLYGTTSTGGTSATSTTLGFGTVFELTAVTGTSSDFSLTPDSASLTVQPGGQATDMITIAPQNGSFGNAIQLSCSVSGPSPMPGCALSPTSVTPGANSARSTLTVTAPTGTAMLAPSIERHFNRSLFAMLLSLTLFGITLVAASKKARWHSWILCGFLLLLLVLQAACGGGSSGSGNLTNHGATNYTVMVTGDANAVAIQHTTQIAITVP